MDLKTQNSQRLISLYSWYLNENTSYITLKMVNDLVKDTNVDEEEAVYYLMAAIFDLDLDFEEDLNFSIDYLKPSLKMLSTKEFKQNPYMLNVLPLESELGDIKIRYQKYKPYELFVYDDFKVEEDKVLPQIGYFKEEYDYLTILKNNREWMLITPNEIKTMEEPIKKAKGHVLTYGLGLGYFAYMTSMKDDVTKVTIVEYDEKIINLFENKLLPFFKNRDKIEIVKEDAYKFASKKFNDNYDFCFIDLWHDVSDGVKLYIDFKALEKINPNTLYEYWIEKTMLVYIKWYLEDLSSTFTKVMLTRYPNLKKEKLAYNEIKEILAK